MEKYIQATPKYITQNINCYKNNSGCKKSKNINQIYLIGSDSSFNAAKQVSKEFQSITNISTFAQYTFEFKENLFSDF